MASWESAASQLWAAAFAGAFSVLLKGHGVNTPTNKSGRLRREGIQYAYLGRDSSDVCWSSNLVPFEDKMHITHKSLMTLYTYTCTYKEVQLCGCTNTHAGSGRASTYF